MELRETDATVRIECFCHRKPLLARAGRDSRTRRSFVWVKVVKNGQAIAEVVLTSGTIQVRCRECLRFHKITLQQTPKIYDIQLVPEEPEKISQHS